MAKNPSKDGEMPVASSPGLHGTVHMIGLVLPLAKLAAAWKAIQYDDMHMRIVQTLSLSLSQDGMRILTLH